MKMLVKLVIKLMGSRIVLQIESLDTSAFH